MVSSSIGPISGFGANHHLRQSLAFLDMPALSQPEAFLQAKEGFFDAEGNVGASGRPFLQGWMDRYVAWVKKHTA